MIRKDLILKKLIQKDPLVLNGIKEYRSDYEGLTDPKGSEIKGSGSDTKGSVDTKGFTDPKGSDIKGSGSDTKGSVDTKGSGSDTKGFVDTKGQVRSGRPWKIKTFDTEGAINLTDTNSSYEIFT